jgi:hypothetical protein
MEGVEILNQFEVAIEHCFNWTVFWFIVGFIGAGMGVIGLLLWLIDNCEFSAFPAMVVIGIVFGVIIGGIFAGMEGIPTKYETRYQVTITDEVKMTEFNERYEILDQEGKIYTVREK